MNLVIISGKIIKIEYKIIDKGKVYAMAFIKMENDTTRDIIQLIAKNDNADEVFRKFNVGDRVLVQGHLQSIKNGIVVIVKNIDKIDFNVEIKNKNGKMDKKSV